MKTIMKFYWHEDSSRIYEQHELTGSECVPYVNEIVRLLEGSLGIVRRRSFEFKPRTEPKGIEYIIHITLNPIATNH